MQTVTRKQILIHGVRKFWLHWTLCLLSCFMELYKEHLETRTPSELSQLPRQMPNAKTVILIIIFLQTREEN